uniref:Transcription initiation factor TFIID subunit 11 n=1 Tax=Ascaris lumbricoides TaxID=6252 RepID=A0A0M3HYU6_ASCLU
MEMCEDWEINSLFGGSLSSGNDDDIGGDADTYRLTTFHDNQSAENGAERSQYLKHEEDDSVAVRHLSTTNESDELIQEKMRLLVANFSPEQLERFECYRQSSFPRRKVRRLIRQSTGQNPSENFTIAVAGLAKLFIGELIEEALDIAERLKENDKPLKPHHIELAYESLRRRARIFPVEPRPNPFL